MKSLKINSSIAILLFINFIFCFKYSSRYSEFGFHIATILLVIQFLVFKYGNKISLSNKLKKINVILDYFVTEEDGQDGSGGQVRTKWNFGFSASFF